MCPTTGESPQRSRRLDSLSTASLSTTPSEDGSCEVLVCFGTAPAGLLERLSTAVRGWGRPRRWPHWAVVLSYADDKVLYCCGCRDPRTGHLVGTATWRTTAQLQAIDVHRISLGEHSVSVEQLHEAMTGLSEGGQYRAVHNDSQTWAVKLLNRLSLDIPE